MADILPLNPLAYYTAPKIDSVFWQPDRGMVIRPIEVHGATFPCMMKTQYLPEWSKVSYETH